ncbi:hypothetical protein Dsin_016281 [Dipteronia sinensis]|uniref:hAT-like transposase RNase-H fold domain-containing protein n=1 Tax=Dipteronia sinensis TaxID=43782 RepID=A0AAE0ACT7_9ROSI|nr:hypothetical protein Dsin_016281 [Dipteronia sinensis]
MVDHLKPFYKLTELFSGTKYPTANLVFPMICKMRETLNGWLNSRHIEIQNYERLLELAFKGYLIHGEKSVRWWSTVKRKEKMFRVELVQRRQDQAKTPRLERIRALVRSTQRWIQEKEEKDPRASQIRSKMDPSKAEPG